MIRGILVLVATEKNGREFSLEKETNTMGAATESFISVSTMTGTACSPWTASSMYEITDINV